MEFVDTADAAWRATLGSCREERVGQDVRLIPDFTIPMAADLVYREIEASDPCPEDFLDLFEPGSFEWNEFFKTRKIVTRSMPDGKKLSAVTSNIADALRLAREDYHLPSGGRPKQYEVVHLLTDLALKTKFSLVGAIAARMRNLAVVDTQRAAKELQKHVRAVEGYENAIVVVGKYAGSWKASRDSIKMHAAKFPMTSVATDATIIGDKIFIYSPFESQEWRVYGPVAIASLVQAVHRMVQRTSCEAVMFAFGPELTMLDIDIHDGIDTMCPIRESHAGSHSELPLQSMAAVGAHLSAEGRRMLASYAGACETLAVDGEDVATAVRVTGRYVLINAHVVREGGVITCNGLPVTPYRMVSPDLWLAKARGPDTAWHLRKADPGEKVLLCYRRHQELQVIGPVSVHAVAPELLTLDKHGGMQPGVSGAAVVALRDFALLGVHDAVSMRKSISAVFSPEMYTDVCSMSELGDSSHASADANASNSVYMKMKERGLGKVVDSAMAATVGLYSGKVHVGMGFPMGSRVYTTCDPDLQPLSVGASQNPLVFSREGSYFVAEFGVPSLAVPAVVRQPSYGEKVFVVGKDDEGEYFSTTEAKVMHVGVGATTFQVAGLDASNLPLQGGLVLSMADAAVLGVYASRVFDQKRGTIAICRALPEQPVLEVEERPEAAVQRIFPMLRPAAWPEGVASSVITHASGVDSAMVAYAMVGDSAMRTLLMGRLLDSGLPTSKWSAISQADQCNASQAKMCEKLGLHNIIRVGGGLNVVSGSKVYADLLEAVAGAAYLYEPPDSFEKFCEVAGAVRESYSVVIEA